ncbi:MAG TPA: hypothetical protein DCQ99_07605 [Nitrospinae bacterium]|nr:hypothetical protein [Nitrospinota bacterium]
MISAYFKRLFISNKTFILHEVLEVQGLMHMLMKHHNTGEKWTRDEVTEIKMHLKEISRAVPALVIFMLPGGSLLLPFLAEAIDRRGGQGRLSQ